MAKESKPKRNSYLEWDCGCAAKATLVVYASGEDPVTVKMVAWATDCGLNVLGHIAQRKVVRDEEWESTRHTSVVVD